MAFTHGVYTQELTTKVYAVRTVDSAIPFVVGTAPVHNLPEDAEKPINKLVQSFTYTEFVRTFGEVPEGEDPSFYTLSETARVLFTLYKTGPIICVNVFDPEKHYSSVAGQSVTFDSSDQAELGHIAVRNVVVKSADGLTTYVEGTDYTVDYLKGVLTRISTGAIPAGGTVSVSYDYADVTKVTSADIIGGVDALTGERTGIELIEEVFPEFGKLPGIILVPRYGEDPAVANVAIAKAELFNLNFKCMAYLDVPKGTATSTDAVAYKQNFGSPHAVFFYPYVKEGDREVPLSIHAAGLTAKVDYENGGVPFESPSNKELFITGPTKVFPIQEANYLNEQGIVTVNRIMTGWKLWGNRTSAFPGNTDIKDAFIPCRRMANWIENNLVLNTWQKVDDPMNRRLITSVKDSTNIWLNGLTGMQMLLGARVEFLEEENPETDLTNGIIRFHIYYLAPPPAETIEFKLEVDTSYLKNLFE